ncbi:MAG: S-adenosylmethionine:tRNA ribosyltransferase-isomerase, partial [Cyclobacteriaceae bacterium]
EGKSVIAVGTTSLRTIESLYWFGVRLMEGASHDFMILQNDPYNRDPKSLPTKEEALRAVLAKMSSDRPLVGETSIFILPGYKFRICEGLITNFHQPGSTLMLLVAAFVGDQWKKIYREALDNEYRFLSYGDSSLLLPK